MDIIASGMVCSVGLTAAAACAAIRAKVAGFDDLPYLDNDGEPIVGAAVPGLDPALSRRGRLVELLALALEDGLATAGLRSTGRIPLIVGLSEPDRPGGGGAFADSIVADVQARLGLAFDASRSKALPLGHVAGFEGLRMAREYLRDETVPACLVCGVDSYLNARSLDWLDRHSRLKTEANSDGVIPGEAAACVLVARRSAPKDPLTSVIGMGFGREDASVMTETPLLGIGLASAGRAALEDAGLTMRQIDFRVSDVAGESFGFREQLLILCRLLDERRDALPLWHVAEAIGETGAAAGVIQLVVTRQSFLKGYAPGPRVLCLASSDNGNRAAAIVGRRSEDVAEPAEIGLSREKRRA